MLPDDVRAAIHGSGLVPRSAEIEERHQTTFDAAIREIAAGTTVLQNNGVSADQAARIAFDTWRVVENRQEFDHVGHMAYGSGVASK